MAYPESIGTNLRTARKSLRMTQEEVSSALGISRSAISLIESGKRQVSSAELARLANLYHKNVSGLLESKREPDSDGFSVLFRTKEISSDDRIQLVEFEDLCRKYADLMKRLYGKPLDWNIPSYKRPNSHLNYRDYRYTIKELAAKERRRLGLGIAPIKDVFSLLEKQGIRIFSLPLSAKLSGGSTYSEELGPCILLNANHGIRMVFTAIHEYFHCLVDRDIVANICEAASDRRRRSKKEFSGEYFAECFLMPHESVADSYYTYTGHGKGTNAADIVRLSRDFGVSYSAMLVRLKTLSLISESDYIELGKAHPEKIAEWLGLPAPKLPDPLPGKYVYAATRLYFHENISIGKLAEYSKRSIAETQAFVANLRESLPIEEIFEIAQV